ncbi:restriction endonuclease subunit S [uncultured Polaribacter sp.]|uniref:restriction endonuclease subunit S n=1 Tax=uncultured Polaribacter sp. TaxID=174711 RepID=UPI00263434AB|nr:restriction endonuclease subunit S [uncultured Polaribacter sp.]
MSKRDTNNIKKQELKDCFVPRNDNQDVITNGVKQSTHKKEIASARLLRTSQQELRNDVRVPKLRFKEFNDEWKQNKLGEVSSKVSYGMNAAAISFDGKHKYLRITDIDENTREFRAKPLTSPDGLIEDKFKMKLNDIVFARTGASTGKSYLYKPNDGDLYYAGFLIKFNITKANSYFIYAQTFRESYNKWVQVYSMRSGQPGLNAEEYKNLKLNIPSLQEQQKIASFLTEVDTKIQQLTRKKELLENYKKGAMQQLFSQQLRFKNDDGTDFSDWEEKKLGEVFKIFNGYAFSSKDSKDKGVLWVKIADVGIQKMKKNNISFLPNSFFEKYKKFILETGDYVIALTRPILNGKLKIARINEYFNNSLLNQRVGKIITKNNKDFVYFLLQQDFLIKSIENNIAGSDPPNLSPSEINNLKVLIPSLKEQQKIANYLSAIDTKIENVQTQIEKTQAFKKGLLQQLFV